MKMRLLKVKKNCEIVSWGQYNVSTNLMWNLIVTGQSHYLYYKYMY